MGIFRLSETYNKGVSVSNGDYVAILEGDDCWIPDKLEKQLRIKTVERFGGKKGDLSKAVEEAIKTWLTKEK